MEDASQREPLQRGAPQTARAMHREHEAGGLMQGFVVVCVGALGWPGVCGAAGWAHETSATE